MAFFRKNLLKLTYAAVCGSSPLSISCGYPVETPDWSEKQVEKLKRIVAYAMESSCFYRDYYSDFLEGVSVKDMPVDEFLEVFENLPYLEKEHLRGENLKKIRVPEVKGYLRMTSGSTGTPVKVYVDKNTLAQQLKARWIFFAWHGVKPGDLEGRFWGRSSSRQFRNYVKNFLLSREVFQFDSDDSVVIKNMKRLEDLKPKYFYGYPSILMKYAEAYDGSIRKRPQPKVILTTAETLNEVQRNFLSDIFNCPVYQEYGCSEVDIIAFECKQKVYHTNTSRLFIDFKNNEEDFSDISITDFDNICTPLIKYKLNDSVKLTDFECGCNMDFGFINNIVGRTSGRVVFLPGGRKIHLVEISYVFNELVDSGAIINNYQIIHKAPDEITVIIDTSCDEFYKIVKVLSVKLDKISNNTIKFKYILGKVQFKKKNTYYLKEF